MFGVRQRERERESNVWCRRGQDSNVWCKAESEGERAMFGVRRR